MGIIYLDSSLALRTILDSPERTFLQTWMDTTNAAFVSSRLLRTEVVRVLRREARPLSDGRPLLERIGLIDITRETHTVAEAIERHTKTLDALHLATALIIGDSTIVASHDKNMLSVAEALGLRTIDPIEQRPTRP